MKKHPHPFYEVRDELAQYAYESEVLFFPYMKLQLNFIIYRIVNQNLELTIKQANNNFRDILQRSEKNIVNPKLNELISIIYDEEFYCSRQNICSKLKYNDDVFKTCIYITSTDFDASSFEIMFYQDILYSITQRNYDYLSNCKYYTSKCDTIKLCTSYTIPIDVNKDALKLLLFQNIYDVGRTNFCSFIGRTPSCDVSQSYTEYSGLTFIIRLLTICRNKWIQFTHLRKSSFCSFSSNNYLFYSKVHQLLILCFISIKKKNKL